MRNHALLLACAAALASAGCGDDTSSSRDLAVGADLATSGNTCTDYCTKIAASCTGTVSDAGAGNVQYPDTAKCLSICMTQAGWPAGNPPHTSGGTRGCRVYHAGAPPAMNPTLHCAHAGAPGGNGCGTWCENYCYLAKRNCTATNQLFMDDAACMTACAKYNTTGSPNATVGDTVQCRIYHLINAGADAASATMHCPHGGVSGG